MDMCLRAADYMLALATNTVTDEVRDAYKSEVVDYKSGMNIFDIVLRSVLKAIDDGVVSVDLAFNLVENEYNMFNLSAFLGEFTKFADLIHFILDAKNHTAGKAHVEDLKRCIEIADKLDEGIAISMYYSVLVRLAFGTHLFDDIEFSRKVMQYVKNSTTTVKLLSEVINDALDNI